MKHDCCRMCKNNDLFIFLDLGFSALSDGFLTKEQLDEPENTFPLNVCMCKNCGLIQLGYVVSPQLMFNENYPYDSSTTARGREHFVTMGKDIYKKFSLKQNSLAIDIGSNAGVLLSGFKEMGMRVIGIEPSANIAKIAQDKGIDTICDFFSKDIAKRIIEQHGQASVITGTNVFAHIDNLDDFMTACNLLLVDDGIIVIEAPYLLDLINNMEYDTIYHEHLSYISVKPLSLFLEKYEMEIFDIEKQSIHGGTLRYYISRKERHEKTSNVNQYIELENECDIYSVNTLTKFAKNVSEHRLKLNSLLLDLKNQGKKIVAISAPAKGNTLLNYCKIDQKILEYVTEKNPLKINKFTPGMHIPVYSDEKLLQDMPDYALILAWNFSEEIIKNNDEYRKKGGKFIIPIPTPKII